MTTDEESEEAEIEDGVGQQEQDKAGTDINFDTDTVVGTWDGHRPGAICWRCFNFWKVKIEKEDSIPECLFANGGEQRKCEYCSKRRSQCDRVRNAKRETKEANV